MQLLAQHQARAAAHRRVDRSKLSVTNVRRGTPARRPARLVAGSRRPSVRVQAEVQTAPAPTNSPIAVGTIALRKAVAQAAYKGSSVIVAGGQGQLAIRIIRELLAAGFKVTAVVSDLDAATAAFSFFKRYELIDKAAAANLKLVTLSSLEEDEEAVKALTKRSKVVVVDGDVEGKGKTGAKDVQFALALAEASSASQVVLVSTQQAALGTNGGGGLFGGLFGAPKPAPIASSVGKPLERLGKLEELVAESGKPYAIVRAYGTDVTDDGAEPGSYFQIGTLGSVPTTAVSSKAQVASVVSELLKAAGPSNGLVFEMSASVEEQLSPADSIGEIIAAAEGAAAEAAAAVAEAAAKEAPPSMGLFNLGTMSVLRKATAAVAAKEEPRAEAEQQAVSEPEEPPKKAVGSGFFGFGAKKLAEVEKGDDEQAAPPPSVGTLSARRAAQAKVVAKAAEDEVVVAAEPSKKTGSGFFSFGTSKVVVKKEVPKEEPKEEEPAKKTPGLFGFGTARVAVKKPAQEEEEPKEEEEPAKKTGTGFFGFGTAKVVVKKEVPKEEPKEEEPAKKTPGLFGFGTARVAVKKPAQEEEEEEEPAKKTGTGFFGIGTARVAVKKPAQEEETPKRPVRASSRSVPQPPPPEPKRRASPPTPEPLKRSASVRRAPEPVPEPPKRSASVRARTPETAPPPPPPKRVVPAPPAPSRGTTTTTSRPSPASGTSRTSTPPASSKGSVSRSSRSAPAQESAPSYVPGTRGARLAALKQQQEQEQRRK